LEIRRNIRLLERNTEIAICQLRVARGVWRKVILLDQIRVGRTQQVAERSVERLAVVVEDSCDGGVLVIELPAEEKRLLATGPCAVVLDLRHLHGSATRKVGVSAETLVVVPASEYHLSRARAEVCN